MGYATERFVSADLAAEFVCAICTDVARDPQEAVCGGGHIFCADCLGQSAARRPDCPTCNVPLEGRLFLPLDDWPVKLARMYRALKIHCDNSTTGCDTVCDLGDLQLHRDKCPKRKVSCSNEGCGQQVVADKLDHHQTKECAHRTAWCEYCQENISHAGLEAHVAGCRIECECGAVVGRPLLEVHRADTCPHTPTGCPVAGCGATVPRAQVDQHMAGAVAHHMRLLADENRRLAAENEHRRKRESELEREVADLKKARLPAAIHQELARQELVALRRMMGCGLPIQPFFPGDVAGCARLTQGALVSIGEVAARLSDSVGTCHSSPKAILPAGYAFGVRVYFGGEKASSKGYVSVFFELRPGPKDDSLQWPFLRSYTVTLLDHSPQLSHRIYCINLANQAPGEPGRTFFEAKGRPVEGNVIVYGWHLFLSHAELQAAGRQYIVDDRLWIWVHLH